MTTNLHFGAGSSTEANSPATTGKRIFGPSFVPDPPPISEREHSSPEKQRIFGPSAESMGSDKGDEKEQKPEKKKRKIIGPALPFASEQEFEPEEVTEIQPRRKKKTEFFGPGVPTHAEIIQSLEEEAEKEKSKMYDPEQAHRDWELARSGMEYTKKNGA